MGLCKILWYNILYFILLRNRINFVSNSLKKKWWYIDFEKDLWKNEKQNADFSDGEKNDLIRIPLLTCDAM